MKAYLQLLGHGANVSSYFEYCSDDKEKLPTYCVPNRNRGPAGQSS